MYTGPHIIKDGLVFGYDTGYGIADNSTATRFYPGENTVNLLNYDTTMPQWPSSSSNMVSLTSKTSSRSFTVIGTSSVPGAMVFVYPSISANATFHTISATFTNNSTETSNVALYIRGHSNVTSTVNQSQTTTIQPGESIRKTLIGNVLTSNSGYTAAVGVFSHGTSGQVNMNVTDVQFEEKTHATPFVNGTRSSTASLIDLKETTDIDVSNVSFDSTGQPTFDGTDDRITIPAGSYETIGTNDFTIEVVCKNTKTSSYNHFFSVKDQYHFAFKASNTGTKILYVYRTSSLSTSSAIAAYIPSRSDYYHIVCKRQGDNLEIFVNGVSKGTKSGWNNISIDNDSWPSYIGWGNGSEYTKGDIPLAKVYNKALTATEVKQNYNAYKNRFDI